MNLSLWSLCLRCEWQSQGVLSCHIRSPATLNPSYWTGCVLGVQPGVQVSFPATVTKALDRWWKPSQIRLPADWGPPRDLSHCPGNRRLSDRALLEFLTHKALRYKLNGCCLIKMLLLIVTRFWVPLLALCLVCSCLSSSLSCQVVGVFLFS